MKNKVKTKIKSKFKKVKKSKNKSNDVRCKGGCGWPVEIEGDFCGECLCENDCGY